MKINIITMTRDRISYTKTCFESLKRCKNLNTHEYNHYVLDNGSIDGTREYLQSTLNEYKGLILAPRNHGLHNGLKMLRNIMTPCDLVIKIDNDCLFSDINTLKIIADIYEILFAKKELFLLSPKVEGIVNQPTRKRYYTTVTKGEVYTIGIVGQIGGLCMAIPYSLFKNLSIDIKSPMAKGLDSSICAQAIALDYKLGYIENIKVHHYKTTDGQGKEYPEYFKRKRIEEKTIFENN